MKYSDVGDPIWTFTWDGPAGSADQLNSAALDTMGNILAVGETKIDSLNSDLVVVRITSGGQLDWEYFFDGAAGRSDEGRSLVVDTNGVIYVTGSTTLDTLSPPRMLVQKLSSSGQLVWSYVYGNGSEYQCEGHMISIIGDHVHVVGSYYPAVGVYGYVLGEFDTVGNVIGHHEGSLEAHGLSSCAIDTMGNAYIGSLAHYQVTKVSASGSIAWTHLEPTNLPWNVSGDECCALALDQQGNIYMTGRHYGADYLGPTYTNEDILTQKLNPGGALVWSSRYTYQNADEGDRANAIWLDEDSNTYVAGYSEHASLGSDLDFCVVKIDPTGNYVGDLRYAGPDGGDDVLSDVRATGPAVYVVGMSMDGSNRSHIVTQKYENTLSVASVNHNSGLDVFPNPFVDFCQLRFRSTLGNNSTIDLMDIEGRVLLTLHGNGTREVRIDRSDLVAGLYVVRVMSDGMQLGTVRVMMK